MDSINNSFNFNINIFSDLYSKSQNLFIRLFNNGIPFAPPVPSYFQTNQTDYWRMTRHLKKEDLSVLEQKIQALGPNQQTKEATLLRALEKQNWQDPIFQEDYLIYALAAFKEGRLTKNQFATLALYWSAATYNTPNKTAQEIRPIPLFTAEGEPNQEAWHLIEQTTVKDLSSPLDSTVPPFGERNLKALFERMKKSPASEQQLFVYEEGPQEKSQIMHVFQKVGFNILNEGALIPEKEGSQQRIIPSMTLMQETLYVMVGEEQTVEIDPILGVCSLTQIANNALEHQRTMSFPLPYIKPLPEKADGFSAPGVDFTYHDLYHAYMASVVPSSHRQAFARAASVMEQQGEKTPEYKAYIVKLKDMETASYRKNEALEKEFERLNIRDSEKFWLEMILQDPKLPEGQQYKFAPLLIDYFQHQEEWKSEFHIDIQPETKERITEIATYVTNRPQREKQKMMSVWNSIELAWQTQQFIQKEDLSAAKQVIDDAFKQIKETHNQGAAPWAKALGVEMKNPDQAYFFATFNDRKAFTEMLKLLPPDVLPLHLSGCQILDDELLKEVFIPIKKFKQTMRRIAGDDKIHLNGCRSLTSQAIKILAESSCSKFDLSGCDRLVDGFCFLPKETEELVLNHMKSLKDSHLENLIHCSALSVLSLEGNASLTDAALESLAQLPHLKDIRLNGCHKLTPEGIEKLIKKEGLSSINIRGCRNLNQNTLTTVLEEAQKRAIMVFHDS